MRRILIIKHGSFGDIVLSLYAIFSIHKHFKEHEITVLTESKYINFLSNIPFIKNIKVDDRPKIFHFLNYVNLLIWFKKNKFEWVYDLQTSNRTNLYYKFFSIFCEFKWSGIAKKCSHPHLDKNRTKLHTIDRQRKQLLITGINKFENVNWNYFNCDIKNFKIPGRYVILVPGGSISRPEKRWSIKNYTKICKYLILNKFTPVIVGGKDEFKIVGSIQKEKLPVINLIGKTSFAELVPLAKKATFVLGNDTGPMHLLSASSSIKVTKIILFGNDSNPQLCRPVGKNVNILRKKSIHDIKLSDITKLINKKKYSNISGF